MFSIFTKMILKQQTSPIVLDNLALILYIFFLFILLICYYFLCEASTRGTDAYFRFTPSMQRTRDLPIFAKLAKKIHNPMMNGVSTRWKEMDMTGYLVTDLFVGFGASVEDAFSSSCGTVGAVFLVGAAGVGMEWRRLLMSTAVSRMAGGRLSLSEAWLGGMGCPQHQPPRTRSAATTLHALLDRFTPCWSECIAYGLEPRKDCHGAVCCRSVHLQDWASGPADGGVATSRRAQAR